LFRRNMGIAIWISIARYWGVCRGLSHIWCDRVPQVGSETVVGEPATYE
jgi:hypothetical protein